MMASMLTHTSHFKGYFRQWLISCISPVYLCFSLFMLPMPAAADGPDNGPTAPVNAIEPGASFRIQDYIPGTFASRLQYVSLYGSNSGSWNRPIDLYSRRQSQRAGRLPDYYVRNFYTSKSSNSRATGTGSFNRSVHRESPRHLRDNELDIQGYYTGRNTDYHDDEPDLNSGGHGTVLNGVSQDHSAHVKLEYSAENWRYFKDGWGMMLHPSITLVLGSSGSNADVETEYLSYNVGDVLELESRDLRIRDQRGTNTSFNAEGGLYLAVGKGRVYDGTSSWRAIEILTTVADMTGRSPAQVSREEMNQLAAILYELQFKKYPHQDQARLFEYERTERVASQIGKALELENLSPQVVAVIHDILKYYPTFSRYFGQRWYLMIGGETATIKSKSDLKSHDTDYEDLMEHYERMTKLNSKSTWRNKSSRAMVGLAYEVFRPLSQQWQFNLLGSTSIHDEFEEDYSRVENDYWRHDWDQDTTESTSISGDTVRCWRPHRSATIHADMSLYYIKSSRTWWEFSATANLVGTKWYDNPHLESQSTYGRSARGWATVLEGSVEYHHSLAWKLYLTTRFAYTVAYGDIVHPDMGWADDQGGAGSYSIGLTLAYYL